MGSFLTRCCVTNQIIQEGQAVRFIPIIMQSETYRPTVLHWTEKSGEMKTYEVYPPMDNNIRYNSFWTPFGEFMTGTYADYGRVEFDETDANYKKAERLISHLRYYAFLTQEGENPSHDISVDITKLIYSHREHKGWEQIHAIWEDILDLNRDCRIFIRDMVLGGPPRLFQMAVISEYAWAEMLKHNVDRAWTKVKETWANPDETIDRVLQGREGADENIRKRIFMREIEEMVDRALGQGNESGYNLVQPEYSQFDVVRMLEAEVSLDRIEELIRPQIEGRMIKEVMTDLGVRLFPHAYAGQDYSNETGRAYSFLTLRTMLAHQKERDIDNYGEDFLTEPPEEDEDVYYASGRTRMELFQRLEKLLDEIEASGV